MLLCSLIKLEVLDGIAMLAGFGKFFCRRHRRFIIAISNKRKFVWMPHDFLVVFKTGFSAILGVLGVFSGSCVRKCIPIRFIDWLLELVLLAFFGLLELIG